MMNGGDPIGTTPVAYYCMRSGHWDVTLPELHPHALALDRVDIGDRMREELAELARTLGDMAEMWERVGGLQSDYHPNSLAIAAASLQEQLWARHGRGACRRCGALGSRVAPYDDDGWCRDCRSSPPVQWHTMNNLETT